MAQMAATTMMGCTAKRETKVVRSFGIVVMLTNSAKMSAPMRITNSMAVVRALSSSASYSVRQVSARRDSAKPSAPIAPMPAPSVAVKRPP